MAERGRYVLRVLQPSARSTLGECGSRSPLARYVWYLTWYLQSSCCSETHVRPRSFRSFCHLSTLDATHVRKYTRPSPLYHTASDEKLGVGLRTRLSCIYNPWILVKIQPTAKATSLECSIHADRDGANPTLISLS